MPATGEAKLIRDCGDLYASFAFESLATFILGLLFCYLLLLILCKHRLSTPGLAVFRLISQFCANNYDDISSTLSQWRDMPNQPLSKRFAFCRKLNMSICGFSAFASLIAITRWLHVNNINGFRYLGYALTCPLMQAELCVLIAPVVPCYRLNVSFTAFITFVCMITGYIGSCIEGDMWNGDSALFLATWDLDDLQPVAKFWVMLPSFVAIAFLTFVQLPFLCLLYCCRGGTNYVREEGGYADLPHGFLRMLLIVAITWQFFPIWWLLSSEGLSILSDTKANGAGFALSNIISKGAFTLQMLSMVRWHKRHEGRRNSLQDIMAAEEEPWFVTLLRPFDSNPLPPPWAADASPWASHEQFQTPAAPAGVPPADIHPNVQANDLDLAKAAAKHDWKSDLSSTSQRSNASKLSKGNYIAAKAAEVVAKNRSVNSNRLDLVSNFSSERPSEQAVPPPPAVKPDVAPRVNTVLAPTAPLLDDECEEWAGMDTAYKRFLVNAGVGEKTFLKLSPLDRIAMHARYLEIHGCQLTPVYEDPDDTQCDDEDVTHRNL